MILGLTGGIASGKSIVARLLVERGAIHIDADVLVHELYTDASFAALVQSIFESPVLDGQGRVNRALLGKIVFADASALKRLEKLVHPAVAQLRDDKLQAHSEAPYVVLEAVKLIEAGQAGKCDVVWCLWSKPEIQKRRLMEQRHLSESEALARLAHQTTPESKRQLLSASANEVPFVVIENNGTPGELERQVEAQWGIVTKGVR